MTRIAVVDHGAGNLVSIAQGLERSGATALVVDNPDDLAAVDGVVLPGVGATASVMEGIRRVGFTRALQQSPLPLLGICVGMQVLFDHSEEDDANGLGLIPGVVRPLPAAPLLPHIGWNDLRLVRSDPLFSGLAPSPTFYFVHSFAPEPLDPSAVIAETEYGTTFCAAVRSGLRTGVQFHPERSGNAGLRLLANFVQSCRERADAA